VLWNLAPRVQESWGEFRRHGLDDGPGPTAVRYYELARACDALADNFAADMPSGALSDLLELAQHARKHAVRLSATAASVEAGRGGTAERAAGRGAVAGNDAYRGLPDSVAAVSASAHAAVPKQGGAEQVDDGAGRRTLRTLSPNKSAVEKER
jgi:hypothetical protein